MNPAESRPNPDELLAQVQAEETAQHRGRLKIFLGYAAGVGKTYAMLEAAQQRLAEGVDVVVGYIETHRRSETEALVAGLEVLPRQAIEYQKGALSSVTLTEMDVDAILRRAPALALVDELAHTNAPGCRHPKRYQDVEELLAAGIDVYTTLNIQHLESLKDVVAQITGVVVRESLPDRVIDETAEIELIDLPPDELLNRLREGKVYVPEQAARAIHEFFRKGNLTALREMAMRRAAERVDDQMRAYMQTRAIPGPWHAAERLLVCVSPSMLGERLVRSTRRLADELNAEWSAVYVELPEHEHLPQARRDQVARTLRLAEELGARIVTLPAPESARSERNIYPSTGRIARAVLAYARQHNITKIIVGKPLHPRWLDWLRGSLVNQLIQASGAIDIYVITSAPEGVPAEEIPWQPHRPLARYLWSLAVVAAASGLSELLVPQISPTNLVMIYLLAVVLVAVFFGRGPAILASIVSVLVFDYFFVPPYFTFSVADAEYLLTFAGLFIVGVTISYLTAFAREQAQAAQRREADTALLYALSRDLAAAQGLDAILQAIGTHIEQAFGRETIIHLAAHPGSAPPGSAAADLPVSGMQRTNALAPGVPPDENEVAVALWAFEHGEAAGLGTHTLPGAAYRYLPLKTARKTVGVLGVRPKESESLLTPPQRRLLEAFASQAAQAIERVQLADQAVDVYLQIKLLQAAEKLQNALLNSISHDLRTPLVSITGALSMLSQGIDPLAPDLDESARQSLVETAREEADRLNRLVGNLLDMTRLEAGALRVKREACDVQDLIGAALAQVEPRLAGRTVVVDTRGAPVSQPAWSESGSLSLPLVPLDFVLIVHVLVNLLDNALKYSPAGSPLELRARRLAGEVEVAVMDHGLGIPPEDLQRVFDKFYRVQRPEQVTGTGLGLAISKGIIEAHGGRIWAEARPGGGTIIAFALPLESEQEVPASEPQTHPHPELREHPLEAL